MGHASYAPTWSQPLSFPRVLWGHSSRRVVFLFWGADLRLWHYWQMWTMQDPRKMWLATGSPLTVWWKMQSLGARLQQPLAFQIWLSQRLSLCLWGGRALNDSRIVIFRYFLMHNPLFCESTRGHHVALESLFLGAGRGSVIGLPFCVSGVLHQRPEVVLWKLLNIQMIFWWICWGESGLPIPFLCHLGTISQDTFMLRKKNLNKIF